MHKLNHLSDHSTTSTINALDKCLSIQKDFRRGQYYVKRFQQLDTDKNVILFLRIILLQFLSREEMNLNLAVAI